MEREISLYFSLFLFVFFFSFICSSGAGEFTAGTEKLEAVKLISTGTHVLIDNGIIRLLLTKPGGQIEGVSYGGVDNLLDVTRPKIRRGYYDIVWSQPNENNTSQKMPRFDLIDGEGFNIIKKLDDIVEVSFLNTWDASKKGKKVPLNIDKRFIVRRGVSGFYTYAIYKHLEGWPDFDIIQTRIAFHLRKDKFHFMAISDNRKRTMPTEEDRSPERSNSLAYPEAVILSNPIDPSLKGQVDDKYQYSCNSIDTKVHGWIANKSGIGIWQITPSREYGIGGPLMQDLTSHAGPISLNMFISNHYIGDVATPRFRNGEPWKKVFGPVFVYINSVSIQQDPILLWEDAKRQTEIEIQSWPYSFPASEDYPSNEQRGTVLGTLLIQDTYVNPKPFPANSAYVGLALPGVAGSWQRESKGYQFWVKTDIHGGFKITGVREGNYNLYAWVPGVIGDYRYEQIITITPGCNLHLGDLVYTPPRDGPTLWEIGIPDRTSSEFFIPDPNPLYVNKLYLHTDRYRQYGLWDRYTDLYPKHDLIYSVTSNNYSRDWFFAQVTRKVHGIYVPTTWEIQFSLDTVINGTYKLRLAIASGNFGFVAIRINNPHAPSLYSTGSIGRNNVIARHGIHGYYRLYSFDIPSYRFIRGNNSIFLGQEYERDPFQGTMYDYIRLEAPHRHL